MSGKGEWVNLRFPNAFAHPFWIGYNVLDSPMRDE